MKKNILLLGFSILIGSVVLCFPMQYVSAQSPTAAPTIAAGLDNTNYKIPCPTLFCSLEDVLNAAANLIRPIFVLTFIAMLIYGAWLWLTSQGDDKKLGTAKKVIIAAIVGFALAVFAPTIAQFIGGLLGVSNVFSLPTT